MKRLSVRELWMIAALCAYLALVIFITSLPWEKAITGLAGISALTPLALIWQLRK